jgi:hypothetical protein
MENPWTTVHCQAEDILESSLAQRAFTIAKMVWDFRNFLACFIADVYVRSGLIHLASGKIIN